MADPADIGIPGLTDISPIGRGGFGVVYRARQEQLGRTVAVKVLPAQIDETARNRYEREIVAMGTVGTHPNIVNIHDSGETPDGRPYIVMEFMPKGNLGEQLVSNGRYPWQTAVRIGVKLAGALEVAHQAGVLHRDIKPDNVLLSQYNEPELCDFGIARIKGGQETQGSDVTASIAHAAPEVLEGKPPSAESDIFSLAATILTLIYGQPPFSRDTDASMTPVITRILTEPIPPLGPFDVPEGLAQVFDQAMSKDPMARQHSAAEFGHNLQAQQRSLGLGVTEMLLSADTSAPNATTRVEHTAPVRHATPGEPAPNQAPTASPAPTPGGAPTQAPLPPQTPVPPQGAPPTQVTAYAAGVPGGGATPGGFPPAGTPLGGPTPGGYQPGYAQTGPYGGAGTTGGFQPQRSNTGKIALIIGIAAVVLIGVIIAIVVLAGGDGGSDPVTQADMESALLTTAEVPADWTSDPTVVTLDQTAYCGVAPDLSGLQTQVGASFVVGNVNSNVSQTIALFSPGSAETFMQSQLQAAQSCQQYNATGADNVTFTGVPSVTRSDGTTNLEVLVNFTSEDQLSTEIDDTAYVRDGDVIMQLSNFGPDASPDFGTVVQTAQSRLDQLCSDFDCG